MENRIPHLKLGDTICIVAPAKAIEKNHVDFAKMTFESWGLNVIISQNCLGRNNYFSGSIEERKNDLQTALDDENVKAIICARGGYGCVQIVDLIDWTSFSKSPKWLIGFSDVTVLHQRIQNLGLPSIHGTMPLNFEENSTEALETLKQSLFGDFKSISVASSISNITGTASGKIVGGNLSVLSGLIGTNDQIDFQDSILFIEDLAEYKYAIDRMLFAFKKAGVFGKINGVIIGGMTNIKDSEPSFGLSLEDLILSHIKELNIPIAFNFPVGHIDDNRALVFGKQVQLDITDKSAELTYL